MEKHYKLIKNEAKRLGKEYRKIHNVPNAIHPSNYSKYKVYLEKYKPLKDRVEEYVEKKEHWFNHGYEHLEKISLESAYLADKECERLNICPNKKQKIIEMTLLSGLLHDIDRHLGWGEAHLIQGMKTSKILLKEFDIKFKEIPIIVRYHDLNDVNLNISEEAQIAYNALFDADHFLYVTEREEDFWETKERLGVSWKEVIHDYKFVLPLKNNWKTEFGKKHGSIWYDLTIFICEEIEKQFSRVK